VIKISLEILKKKEMPLLSRTRVTAMHVEKGPTVSRRSMRSQIAKQLKEDEEKIVIKHVYSQFGKNDTKIIAHVYTNKEEMEKFENPNLIKKHSVKEEKKEEKAPAEAPKEGEAPKAEEKPKEEKKEEVPKEEKKED